MKPWALSFKFTNNILQRLATTRRSASTWSDQRIQGTELEQIVAQFGEDGFLMMPATRKNYRSRRLASDNVPLLKRPWKDEVLFTLPVVSGPSGSGKTWFMINAKHSREIGLYLTASDLEFPDLEGENPIGYYQRTLESLGVAVSKLVPDSVRRFLQQCQPKECGLFIVIDDIGTSPHLLRALCRCSLGLEESIQRKLGIAVPCDFMVGGTGQDRMDMSCGSIPDIQQLLRMPTNRRVWETLVSTHKVEDGDTRTQDFLRVLETDASALQLATNPRAAVLMLKELRDKSSPVWAELGQDVSSLQAIKGVLPLFLAEVARAFRRMNGMSELEGVAQLEQVYRQALTLVLFPQLLLQNEEKEVKRKLIQAYGVIMDEAVDPNAGHSVYVPPQRYTISPAHVELLRLGCASGGGSVLGEGPVVGAVSRFVEMLLLAGRGCSLQQFLVKLGRSATEDEKVEEKVELVYTGISVIRSSIQSDSDWKRQMQEALSEQKAVMLINEPQNSFADLIVAIPEAALILIHVPEHSVTGEELLVQELCGLARVGSASVFQVAVEQEGSPPPPSLPLLAGPVLRLQASRLSLYPAPFPLGKTSDDDQEPYVLSVSDYL